MWGNEMDEMSAEQAQEALVAFLRHKTGMLRVGFAAAYVKGSSQANACAG